MVPELMEWFGQSINQSLPGLPPSVIEWIEKYGIDMALNLTYEAMKDHIPAHYFPPLLWPWECHRTRLAEDDAGLLVS